MELLYRRENTLIYALKYLHSLIPLIVTSYFLMSNNIISSTFKKNHKIRLFKIICLHT